MQRLVRWIPEDNWMIHASDTLLEGEFLADYERVELLCKSAPSAINELVNWGARFHKESDGRLTQRFFGAHTYRRTVFYEDWTGQEIIRVLLDQVNQRKITIVDDIYITKLLKSCCIKNDERKGAITDKIIGALGIDIKNKEIVTFQCKSLILAAGGILEYMRSAVLEFLKTMARVLLLHMKRVLIW